MTEIRVMFTIKQTNLHMVLQAMQPYATGPVVVGLTPAEDAEPIGSGIDARKVRDLFIGRPMAPEVAETTPDDSPVRPGRKLNPDSPTVAALEILREAGAKGMHPNDFHDAMSARGFERKQSHNAAFFVRKSGKMRKNAAGRFFITREGNSAT